MAILKNTLIVLLLAGGIAAAGEPAEPAAPTASAAPAAPDGKPVAVEGASPARAKACEMASGSRIRPSPATGCKGSASLLRTYTQEDLQRTGQTDTNEALRRLDPIFR